MAGSPEIQKQIEHFLEKQGPQLSTSLINFLVSNYSIPGDTARKRLSRLKFPITKIKGLFSGNQAFYHLQHQYKKPEFYDALIAAFDSSGKQYYAIVQAIEFHYGYIKKEQIAAYSASPVDKLRGHKKIDNIINKLIELGVLYEESDYYKLNPFISIKENFNHFKAVETAKNFVLIQFNDWARNIGLVSYNTGTFYSQFGKFAWSFVSPSYVTTLTRFNNSNIVQGFVIADILIGNRIDLKTIQFFIQKIDVVKTLRGLSNFLPFLIIDEIEIETLKYLKGKGIILGFVDQLFGSEYKELLKSLINTVTNAGAILKKNPQAYLNLIEKLDKLVGGKTNNLRGDLFELAVGYYHSNFCQSLDIGKLINYEGQIREIDVFATYADKLVVAECKGYKNRIGKSQLEDWISNKILIIRKWILQQNLYSNKKIVFEFWSSGGFTDDAKEFIKNIKTRKYELVFIDEKGLIEKSRDIPSKKFKDILRQYYLKEI